MVHRAESGKPRVSKRVIVGIVVIIVLAGLLCYLRVSQPLNAEWKEIPSSPARTR